MKELLLNLWRGKGSTLAGGLVALGLWFGGDAVSAPEWLKAAASALAVFLGAVYPGAPTPKSDS